MVATRVPDVVIALLQVASVACEGWQVFDGPRNGEDASDDVLTIGVGNTADADPYRSAHDLPDLGRRRRETIVIRCQAATWHGDNELATLRSRIVTMLDSLDAAFHDDPTLRGSCASVDIGPARWYHIGETSLGVGIHFDVIAVAFL